MQRPPLRGGRILHSGEQVVFGMQRQSLFFQLIGGVLCLKEMQEVLGQNLFGHDDDANWSLSPPIFHSFRREYSSSGGTERNYMS